MNILLVQLMPLKEYCRICTLQINHEKILTKKESCYIRRVLILCEAILEFNYLLTTIIMRQDLYQKLKSIAKSN